MQPVSLQKKQTPQPSVITNGKATTNPLQFNQPANNPLQLQTKEALIPQPQRAFSNSSQVVQRIILLNGKTYKEGEANKLREDYPDEKFPNRDKDIIDAMNDFSPSPKSLEDAVKDERTFLVSCIYDEEFQAHLWGADLGQALKETKKVLGGSITHAGKHGALIMRPTEGFTGIKIDGLINCVGIVIEARNVKGEVVAAAGGHFVTPANITDHALNDTGMNMISGLLKMVDGMGKLSAITMIAKGNMEGAEKGKAYQSGLEAAGLIKVKLGIPVTHDDGKSEREYKLYHNGNSTL